MHTTTMRANRFEIKNESEVLGHLSSKLIGILTVVKCICGPNLEIVSSICGDLSSGQTQNGVNFDFHVKFDLEGQCRSLHKTIGILTKVFYTFAPNLVILAQTVDELSCGQTHDWRTHGHTHTDTHTQATTIPEGQNWPRVKTTAN